MVGPRTPGCDCHCIAYEPNCLGCASETETPIPLPLSWIMDFPTAMSYYGDSAGIVSIPEYNATGFPQTVTGGTIQKKRAFYCEWEFPDLSALGVSTSLVIDDATSAGAEFGATVDCIWANETFVQYWSLTGNVYFGPTVGNPATWHDAVCSIGSDNSSASPWYYYSAVGPYIPPGLSPNRVRNTISAADALCDTNVALGDGYTRQYSCACRMFGCFAVLKVTNTGSSYDLTVSIYWWPRIYTSRYSKHYFAQTSPAATFWNQTTANNGFCDWTYDATAAIYTLDGNNTKTTVYPLATDGISQGVILVYKASFDCATQYDGSPITLPLYIEAKKAGATQSIADAIGLVDVPAAITITPVI